MSFGIQGACAFSHFSQASSKQADGEWSVSIKSHWWDFFMMMVINPLKIVPTFNHDTIHQPFFVVMGLRKLMWSDKKITGSYFFMDHTLLKPYKIKNHVVQRMMSSCSRHKFEMKKFINNFFFTSSK